MKMRLIQPNDRIFVAGHVEWPEAPSCGTTSRRIRKSCTGGELLTPARKELNLLDDGAVSKWMEKQKPDVVVLAAATVGGIEANRSRPADFLLKTCGSKHR